MMSASTHRPAQRSASRSVPSRTKPTFSYIRRARGLKLYTSRFDAVDAQAEDVIEDAPGRIGSEASAGDRRAQRYPETTGQVVRVELGDSQFADEGAVAEVEDRIVEAIVMVGPGAAVVLDLIPGERGVRAGEANFSGSVSPSVTSSTSRGPSGRSGRSTTFFPIRVGFSANVTGDVIRSVSSRLFRSSLMVEKTSGGCLSGDLQHDSTELLRHHHPGRVLVESSFSGIGHTAVTSR